MAAVLGLQKDDQDLGNLRLEGRESLIYNLLIKGFFLKEVEGNV